MSNGKPTDLGDRPALLGALEAREGDNLVVRYPEMKIGIPGTYCSISLGGSMYTRRLAPGENPSDVFDRVYAFLKSREEAHGRRALQEFMAELKQSGILK